jgi:EmrB/QacA subfamily drug resistance transporter
VGTQPERLGRATVLALAASSLAIFVVANDFTSLSVALPAIERNFHIDLSTVQWTINAYALGFGVLTITGGRLADLFGRRRIFVIGAVLFAGFSLIGALAPNAAVLIAARALMSVGGALMWPAALGMTYSLLPESRRGLAGGLVLGVVGLGNAAGPLIGGVVTDGLGWRYILALNLPIAAVAVIVTLRTTPESRESSAERHIDWWGMLLISGSLVALLLALDEAVSWGWGNPAVMGLLVAAGLLMVALIPVEGRAGAGALIPRDVLENQEFRAALVAVLFMSMTFFTALMYLPQFMEKLLGYSALRAGIGLLPLMVVFAVSSLVAARLYERLGAKRVVVAGAGCLPLGMLALSVVSNHSGYFVLVPGMVLLGVGTGLFYSAAFTSAVSSLSPDRASLASGMIYMVQVAGGSIGLGVATLVVAGNAGPEARAGGHPGAAFAGGLETTFQVSAALAVVGFVVTLLFVGGRLRPRRRRDLAVGRPLAISDQE